MKMKTTHTRLLTVLNAMVLGLAMSAPEVARAADLSNGADAFYKSDKVTMQKVTFKNQYNIKFMNFYPFNDIDTISPRPTLFISGENAHSREFSEEAYNLAAEPKELYLIPNAGHVDLYDRVNLIP